MTAQDALQAEPAPLERSVTLDGFERVLRARRRETTLREHQMRERHLVCANHAHDGPSRPTSHAHVTRLTTPLSSARSIAKGDAPRPRVAQSIRAPGDIEVRSTPPAPLIPAGGEVRAARQTHAAREPFAR